MDETAYPASGVTVNVVVWPCVTTTVEGEIDPFAPADAEMLKDGVTAGISMEEPPPPPPQEINKGIMRTSKAV
jgi:hypothetical protein